MKSQIPLESVLRVKNVKKVHCVAKVLDGLRFGLLGAINEMYVKVSFLIPIKKYIIPIFIDISIKTHQFVCIR